MFGTAVHAAQVLARVGVDVPAEFGGDHHLASEGRQRLAEQCFIRERTVDLGGVEERDASLDRGPDQRD